MGQMYVYSYNCCPRQAAVRKKHEFGCYLASLDNSNLSLFQSTDHLRTAERKKYKFCWWLEHHWGLLGGSGKCQYYYLKITCHHFERKSGYHSGALLKEMIQLWDSWWHRRKKNTWGKPDIGDWTETDWEELDSEEALEISVIYFFKIFLMF